MPQLLACGEQTFRAEKPAQVAGFISEWWPASNRNPGRHQIGISGRIESEFAKRHHSSSFFPCGSPLPDKSGSSSQRLSKMDKRIFIDTETTGLSRFDGDDLVEVSIVDDDGIVLLSTLVNPGRKVPAAARDIHGISDEMVAGSPGAEDVRKMVAEIVRDNDVVIYNADFDRQFLDLCDAKSIACCMLRFAKHAAEWNEYFGNWRWHKLSAAAGKTGFVWPKSGAHRAEADALACRHVWRWLEQHETEAVS